jgi:multidrug efflux pump subunit AcrA (membrane-fusion protein)
MLTKGQKGVAVPVAFPGERLPAKLTALQMIASGGAYPAEIVVKSAHKHATPGMNANVSFVAFEGEDVITVPNAAVHRDGKRYFVVLVKEGENDERREVAVGFTDGKKTVIKRGLSAGDKVRAD